MKKRALVFSSMVAGLVLAVVARLYLFPIDRNQRATATLQSVTDIAEAIRTFKSDFGQFPRDLQQLKSASRSYVHATATLSDAWGQPLVYRIEAGKGFILYSKGGNGIDENGQGDDISPVSN